MSTAIIHVICKSCGNEYTSVMDYFEHAETMHYHNRYKLTKRMYAHVDTDANAVSQYNIYPDATSDTVIAVHTVEVRKSDTHG